MDPEIPLIYTDSPEKECTLIDELYEEISAVSGYDDYLASAQKKTAVNLMDIHFSIAHIGRKFREP